MAKQATSKTNEYEKLLEENKLLKKELEKAKTQKTARKKVDWKKVAKVLSMSFAGGLFVAGSVALYMATTLVNTDKFMTIAGPLAGQPAVQQVVADKTTKALFEAVDVEALAREVLPPRVDFLAPTVAQQIEQFTNNQAKTVLGSDSFQQTWTNTVRSAHERLIAGLKNYEGDGTINISDVYKRLTDRLQGGKLAFLSGVQLPSKIGNITLIEASWLPTAHNLVVNLDAIRIATITLFVLLLGLTLWLSDTRRRTITHLGVMLLILSLIMIISLRVAGTIIKGNIIPSSQQAFMEIWTLFTTPFVIQLTTTFAIGLLVAIVAWLGGDTKTANRVKQRLGDLFAGKLHAAIFHKENAVTLWVGRYATALLTVVGVGLVISMVFIDLTLANFTWAVLIAVALGLIIVTLSGTVKTDKPVQIKK